MTNPITPPRMDREKLARVVNDSDPDNPCFDVRCGEGANDELIWPFDNENQAEILRDNINRAASAWLDREVKKVWDKAWKEVQAEEHTTVHINCPSCGFEGKGSVHATGIVKEIEKAVDAERERCCQAVCMQCRSGAGVELIGGYWVHRAEECDDDMPCSAAAIRSAPGKGNK